MPPGRGFLGRAPFCSLLESNATAVSKGSTLQRVHSAGLQLPAHRRTQAEGCILGLPPLDVDFDVRRLRYKLASNAHARALIEGLPPWSKIWHVLW
jgi:hypothetical protein